MLIYVKIVSLYKYRRGVAQLARALAWGARGFAGSSPVTPTN
jgi:hypothetical protein